jgi:hypothetical protein
MSLSLWGGLLGASRCAPTIKETPQTQSLSQYRTFLNIRRGDGLEWRPTPHILLLRILSFLSWTMEKEAKYLGQLINNQTQQFKQCHSLTSFHLLFLSTLFGTD